VVSKGLCCRTRARCHAHRCIALTQHPLPPPKTNQQRLSAAGADELVRAPTRFAVDGPGWHWQAHARGAAPAQPQKASLAKGGDAVEGVNRCAVFCLGMGALLFESPNEVFFLLLSLAPCNSPCNHPKQTKKGTSASTSAGARRTAPARTPRRAPSDAAGGVGRGAVSRKDGDAGTAAGSCFCVARSYAAPRSVVSMSCDGSTAPGYRSVLHVVCCLCVCLPDRCLLMWPPLK
jgi:hypothetical protein